MKDAPVYLGLGVVVLIGLGLFSLGARNLFRALASRHWPSVEAVVVESSTQIETTTPSRGFRRSGPASSVMYTANLKFQYEVDGRKYRTDQIYFGQTVGSGDSSEAELRRFRYPLGERVTVHYNPADPSVASVHPGFQAEALWLPGAGLAFLVPAIMAFIIFRSAFEGASGMAVGLTIFTLVFMTIGAILLFFGGRSLWRAWQSPAWPTARGVIVYGTLQKSQSTVTTSDDEEYTQATYNAPIVFRFEVGGKRHYSNTRRFGQLAGSDSEWASKIAQMYPLGREVTVWYNPDTPDLATLEPGISKEAFWGPGAGAAFFLFGLAALVFGVPALTKF